MVIKKFPQKRLKNFSFAEKTVNLKRDWKLKLQICFFFENSPVGVIANFNKINSIWRKLVWKMCDLNVTKILT